MPASKYTDAQREEALRIHLDHGASEAARRTGIPKPTIASWARRDGVQTRRVPPPGLIAAQETAVLAKEQRRHVLADGLLDDVDRLRTRLFEPMQYQVVKVVSDGEGGTYATTHEYEAQQPTPTDQLKLAQSIVALIEKAQLLVGEATSRDEAGGLDLEAELRQHQAAMAERAAMTKAKETL